MRFFSRKMRCLECFSGTYITSDNIFSNIFITSWNHTKKSCGDIMHSRRLLSFVTVLCWFDWCNFLYYVLWPILAANTIHRPNAVPMLGQIRRRWTNIGTALGRWIVFAGLFQLPVAKTKFHKKWQKIAEVHVYYNNPFKMIADTVKYWISASSNLSQ